MARPTWQVEDGHPHLGKLNVEDALGPWPMKPTATAAPAVTRKTAEEWNEGGGYEQRRRARRDTLDAVEQQEKAAQEAEERRFWEEIHGK